MTTATAAAPATGLGGLLGSQRAILSRGLDAWMVGGLSLLGIVSFFAFTTPVHQAALLAPVPLLHLLVNYPHFIASWGLLYGSPETRARHRWATVHLPLALVAYGVFAMAMAPRSKVWLDLTGLATSTYLAFHYTGQAWGMIATFARLEDLSIDAVERRLLLGSIRYFLVWQILWNLHYTHILTIRPPSELELVVVGTAFRYVSYLAPLAVAAGLAGFFRLRKRSGRTIPIRVGLPWLALCFWYALMARSPAGGIFWVQVSHALQYLMFPLRVEANRFDARTRERPGGAAGRRRALHLVAYGVGLVAVGWLVFEGPNWAGSHLGLPVTFGYLTANLVNIHHYFTDGVVWKLRNPAVRRELFAHLA